MKNLPKLLVDVTNATIEKNPDHLTIMDASSSKEVALVWHSVSDVDGLNTGQELANLFQNAPQTLDQLNRTYLFLLNHLPDVVRYTLEAQHILAGCRAQIARAYDCLEQDVENQ